MKRLSDEVVFGHKSAEPTESIQLVQFGLPDEIRHSGETADAEHVERKVVLGYRSAEIHLKETLS